MLKFNFILLCVLFFVSCSTTQNGTITDSKAARSNDARGITKLHLLGLKNNESNLNGLQGNDNSQEDGDSKSKTINGSAKIEVHEQGNKDVYFLANAEELKLKNYYFDIPVVYNKQVKKWLNYFLNKGKDYFIRYSERSGIYAPIMGQILEINGLPRDLIFLAMAESGFQNNAKSHASAVGPWQFMSFTGRKFGLNINFYVDERRDPFKATIAASNYLKELYELFGSWELAAAGYNAGEGKVGRAIKKYSTENFWAISEKKFLKSETRNYVPKIMALAIIGKNLDVFGLEDIKFSEPLDFDEIDVRANSDLFSIAQALNIESDELFRLNPELLRWQTPPHFATYKLRVPPGVKVTWDECCKNQDFTAQMYQTYEVTSSHQSYHSIAKHFKVPPEVIRDLNKIEDGSIKQNLKKGTVVLLPFRNGQNIKDAMYADLYDLPRRSILRKRDYRSRIQVAMKKGTKVTDPKEFYFVRKGDTLWDVSNKTGVSLNTIIKSNSEILNMRPIREGDKLVIR